AEHALHGGNAVIAYAAGDDGVEELQIRGNVEGESVGCDPAGRDAHAYGGDLLAGGPDAGEPRHASGGDGEGGERADESFLDVADVAVQVAAVGLEVQDGIADELSRAVIGDIPAAAGLEEFDAEQCPLT